jgi:hypothetical protein
MICIDKYIEFVHLKIFINKIIYNIEMYQYYNYNNNTNYYYLYTIVFLFIINNVLLIIISKYTN